MDRLIKGFINGPSTRGLNFRPQFQSMNGCERYFVIDNYDNWRSVKNDFLSIVYRHSTVSFIFFKANSSRIAEFKGILCLGNLHNQYLFFILRDGSVPIEISTAFKDCDIVKIGFDSGKYVKELCDCGVFRKSDVRNVLSLQDTLGQSESWKRKISFLNPRLSIEANLMKFILLCTGHDAYKLSVRKRLFETDMARQPIDFTGKLR